MNKDLIFLKHIVEEANFLKEQCQHLTLEKSLKDPVLKRACLRSLEIFGKAAKQIFSELKMKYRLIEWKKIAGFRDKLIHYYFGVDWQIAWDVIVNKVPDLEAKISEILKETQNS